MRICIVSNMYHKALSPSYFLNQTNKWLRKDKYEKRLFEKHSSEYRHLRLITHQHLESFSKWTTMQWRSDRGVWKCFAASPFWASRSPQPIFPHCRQSQCYKHGNWNLEYPIDMSAKLITSNYILNMNLLHWYSQKLWKCREYRRTSTSHLWISSVFQLYSHLWSCAYTHCHLWRTSSSLWKRINERSSVLLLTYTTE